MTSRAQVRRLMALVPYLQQHPGVTVATVAELFSVTPRQIVADLHIAWMVGLGPGMLIDIDMDALEGEGTIHLTNAEFLSRPTRFTPDEATSLVVALRSVRELAPTELVPAVDSAIAKLRGATSSTDEPVHVYVASGDADTRTVLGRAISDDVAVRLTYDGARRGATTEPTVDPRRLFTRDGVGYLRGWDVEAGDWRTYRLDRIHDVEVTDQPVSPHPAPPAEDEDWLAGGTTVTLLLDHSARWVAEYYPVRRVQDTTDGLQVELSVIDQSWLNALLLRLAGSARVLEPGPAAATQSAARTVLDAYRAAGLLDSET